jgi:hypothetical protein
VKIPGRPRAADCALLSVEAVQIEIACAGGTVRRQRSAKMKNLIRPAGVSEKELETYIAGLSSNAQKGVRNMLAAGAGEAEIAEYMASLGPEPEDEIGPPEGQPPVRIEGSSSHLPSRQHEPPIKESRPVTGRQRVGQAGNTPDRTSRTRRGKVAEKNFQGPPGVHGANVGYWQAGGVTRAGAKRSKRP